MSKLYVDELHPKTSGKNFIIPPAGGIVQVQYDQLTTSTTQTIATADTYTKLTNFPSVTITPVSTSSKLKIDVMWNGEFGVADNQYNNAFVLYRDSTLIKGNTDTGGHVTTGMWGASTNYYAIDADSTAETMNGTYYDEPNTTSAITYYLGIILSTADTLYINRVVNATATSGYERLISSMTVTEIAG